MPGTFAALWVLVLAMLPGALYTWMRERESSAWGVKASDRLFRFIGMSVLFQVVAAPVTYALYSKYIHSGVLKAGRPLPLWLWGVVLLYVGVPLFCGWLVGRGVREGKPWVRAIVGPAPAPTAWEHFFATSQLGGWLRIRLNSGEWICGVYAQSLSSGLRSYASGYEDEQDLFLAETVECDVTTGEILTGEDGNWRLRNAGVLLRWSEISYIEYFTPEGE